MAVLTPPILAVANISGVPNCRLGHAGAVLSRRRRPGWRRAGQRPSFRLARRKLQYLYDRKFAAPLSRPSPPQSRVAGAAFQSLSCPRAPGGARTHQAVPWTCAASPMGDNCAFCLAALGGGAGALVLPCGHAFHSTCALQFLLSEPTTQLSVTCCRSKPCMPTCKHTWLRPAPCPDLRPLPTLQSASSASCAVRLWMRRGC